jgi:hypothetical protein
LLESYNQKTEDLSKNEKVITTLKRRNTTVDNYKEQQEKAALERKIT